MVRFYVGTKDMDSIKHILQEVTRMTEALESKLNTTQLMKQGLQK